MTAQDTYISETTSQQCLNTLAFSALTDIISACEYIKEHAQVPSQNMGELDRICNMAKHLQTFPSGDPMFLVWVMEIVSMIRSMQHSLGINSIAMTRGRYALSKYLSIAGDGDNSEGSA